MTSPTTTLADWLLAQIAADEAVAREAGGATAGPWSVREVGDIGNAADIRDVNGWAVARATTLTEHATHIARHDPARVLAECAAFRAIVEEHQQYLPLVAIFECCQTCGQDDGSGGLVGEWPCPTLRALASIWRDRDGWREEWS